MHRTMNKDKELQEEEFEAFIKEALTTENIRMAELQREAFESLIKEDVDVEYKQQQQKQQQQQQQQQQHTGRGRKRSLAWKRENTRSMQCLAS